MRDGPKGTKFFFKLELVLVGKDKWAVDEYSMVVQPLIKTTTGSSFDAVCDDVEIAETRDKLSERDERDANIHTMGPRGTRTTVGMPGTGVSYTSYGKSSSWVSVAFWALLALLVCVIL
jgi:hypothetical protein